MNKGLGYPTLLDGLKPAGPKSNVELRASAAGGFGPRDPLGRKNSATSTAQRLSYSACRPSRNSKLPRSFRCVEDAPY